MRLMKCASSFILLAFMSASFVAPPGQAQQTDWSAPIVIGEGYGGYYESPSSASNSKGEMVVAWAAYDWNASVYVLANRYVPGQGWAGLEVLAQDPDVIGYAAAGIDDSGNCLVAWAQGPSIQSRTHTVGKGWGPTEQAASSTSSRWFYDVKLAVAPDGSAIVTWFEDNMQADPPTGSCYRPAGSGWDSPSVFQTSSTYVMNARLAVDGGGNFMVVYTAYVGSEWGVWYNTYTHSSGWGAEAKLESHPGAAYDVQVAMNRAGQAVAVWQQFGYPYDNFPVAYGARYEPGTGWATQVRLEDPTFGGSDPPSVSIDSVGNAVVIWRAVTIDMRSSYLRWTAYSTISGWGLPATLEHSDSSTDAHVATGISGIESYAVWIRVVIVDGHFDSYELVANHFNTTNSWETPTVLVTDIASSPSLTADNLGGAAVFWFGNETSPAMFVSQCPGSSIPSEGITAAVNIDPDTVNPRRMGKWLTAYINLPSGYDVNDIVVESVRLNGMFPATGPSEIKDFDKDGAIELMVKFDWRKALRMDSVPVVEAMTFTVSGILKDDTAFQGSDNVTILPSTHGSSALSSAYSVFGSAGVLPSIAVLAGVLLLTVLLAESRRVNRPASRH